MAYGHNRDHGPDCTCGCHGNEHGHGREHEHGHQHDHVHHHGGFEAVELEWGRVELEAHVHDQATTVSMNVLPQEGCTITFSDLIGAMQSIAEAAEGAGGIVGHIKGLARQGSQYAHASVTSVGLAPTVEGDSSLPFGSGAAIQLVAIVLLIGQEDLLAICKSALAC